jgi:hypothetical protein
VEWRMVGVSRNIPSPRTRLPLPSALSLASPAKHAFPPLVFSRHAPPPYSSPFSLLPCAYALPLPLSTKGASHTSRQLEVSPALMRTNLYDNHFLPLTPINVHPSGAVITLPLRILIHNPHDSDAHSSNKRSTSSYNRKPSQTWELCIIVTVLTRFYLPILPLNLVYCVLLNRQ